MSVTPPDAIVSSGRASLRLTTTTGGRFRVLLESSPISWVASFGDHARVTDVRTTGDVLAFRYRPAPDVVVGSYGSIELAVTFALSQRDGGVGVDVVIEGPEDYPIAELAGPTITPGPEASTAEDWRYLVPDGEGLWLSGDGSGQGWRPRVSFHDHRVTLPMTAVVDDRGAGIMVSAINGHDHAVDLLPGVGPSLPSMRLVNLPSLGQWRYSREWSIVTVDSGGAPSLARELSRQLNDAGIELQSQGAKLAARGIPSAIRESVGGSLVWCHFDSLTASIVGDIRSAGLTSVMLMGRPADAAASAALAASPFGSGPYFQTYDVYPPGTVEELGWRGTYPPEGASDGWSEDLIHDIQGWLDAGWSYLPFAGGQSFWRAEEYLDSTGQLASRARAIHNELAVRSYRRCPARHRHVVEERGLPMLDSVGATAVFYDIATAIFGLECYSPDHPVDRRADVAHRRDNLALFNATGRILHSEGGKWWAIDDVSAFEGLFSYDQELDVNCIQLTDYPSDPSRRAFEFNLEHRVPFFGMVARHAVSRTMWWGTGQDRHSDTWGSKDALTALFGANPIFVVDPDHPLSPGSTRWDRFVSTASAFDVLRREAADCRVSSFENDGRDLGRTVFENGASVEANVGLATSGGLEPGQFIVRDAAGSIVANVTPPAAAETLHGGTAAARS